MAIVKHGLALRWIRFGSNKIVFVQFPATLTLTTYLILYRDKYMPIIKMQFNI